MLILLSPSKTQKPINRHFPHFSLPVFNKKTLYLANYLKSLDKTEIRKLMKTSEKLTENTFRQIQSFSPPFSIEKTQQAIFTFQGDAFFQMTPKSYSEEELLYLQEHLCILSGLYGILRPLDLMFPYRLEMGAKLTSEKTTNLYHYWSDVVTDYINSSLAETKSQTGVNLASVEYFKTVNRKHIEGEIITIVFRQHKNGVCKTIPIYSKRARGLMTHFAVTHLIEEVNNLKSFNLDGYSYRKEESTKETWVFDKK